MIDVSAIGQEDISKGAPILVLAVCLERDRLTKNQRWRSLLGSIAVSLALLGAVDAVETDAFRMVIVQDFDGVAVGRVPDAFPQRARARPFTPNDFRNYASLLRFLARKNSSFGPCLPIIQDQDLSELGDKIL